MDADVIKVMLLPEQEKMIGPDTNDLSPQLERRILNSAERAVLQKFGFEGCAKAYRIDVLKFAPVGHAHTVLFQRVYRNGKLEHVS